MEEKAQFSIFDTGITAAQLTRSNQRRKAVIIPFKKGMEMAAKVQKEFEG